IHEQAAADISAPKSPPAVLPPTDLVRLIVAVPWKGDALDLRLPVASRRAIHRVEVGAHCPIGAVTHRVAHLNPAVGVLAFRGEPQILQDESVVRFRGVNGQPAFFPFHLRGGPAVVVRGSSSTDRVPAPHPTSARAFAGSCPRSTLRGSTKDSRGRSGARGCLSASKTRCKEAPDECVSHHGGSFLRSAPRRAISSCSAVKADDLKGQFPDVVVLRSLR